MLVESLYYRIIGPDRGWYLLPVYWVLKLVSWGYRWGVMVRHWAYSAGLFRVRRLDCRVICVGNLTLGGTGKTPMVLWIADTLRRQGHRPAVISRGYRGSAREEVNVVCDGTKVLLSPELAGDEPVMLAERLGNVPVLTGRDRYRAGRRALEQFGVDTLILDDGFQHLGLHRDLNLLLLDKERPFGNGSLFPAGTLREPVSAIRRAHLICLTRCWDNGSIGNGRSLPPDTPVIKTVPRLATVAALDSSEQREAESLKDRPVAAFCGIARPDDFRRVLEGAGARVVFFKPFPDHHNYSRGELQSLEKRAREAGAQWILTTEKDAVKLNAAAFQLPVMKVRIALDILEGGETLMEQLLQTPHKEMVGDPNE